ncbi:MAG: EpsI family protein [Candidatus Omnitrophica bacterium]|nr:EpsI family protein [Candidatus Omnitrophota bacterium]
MKSIKFTILLILMAAMAALSWHQYLREYHQKDKVDIHMFPMEVDGWTAENLTITDEEYEILETRNAWARLYRKDEKQVMLYIVYSEHNRKVSHPPEVCYIGSGVSIASNQHIKYDNGKTRIQANRLDLQQGRYKQVAYYWFKVGGTYTSSYWGQQLLIVAKTLLGKPSSSALIRFSVNVDERGEAFAEETLREFSFLADPVIREYLP